MRWFFIALSCCSLFSGCASTSKEARIGDTSDGLGFDHFFLPRIQFRDAPLRTALHQIREQYQDIARQCGETKNDLSFELQGDSTKEVTLDAEDGVFLDTAIRLVALQANMQATFAGDRVSFLPLPAAPLGPTKSWKVPPTFLFDTRRGPGSPFRPADAPDQKPPDAEELLRDRGLIKDRDTRVTYEASSSTLLAKGTGSDLRRLNAYVRILVSGSPIMIKVQSKRVIFNQDTELETGTFSEEATNRWLRKALRQKGAIRLETLPSITARPSQSGTVELITEILLPDGPSWLGTRLTMQPKLLGPCVVPDIRYERRLLTRNGGELPLFEGENLQRMTRSMSHEVIAAGVTDSLQAGEPVPFKTRKATIADPIPNGRFVITKATGSSHFTEYLVVQVTRIDAAGRPIE